MIFHDKGGDKAKTDFAQRGGGVHTPTKKDDIIYEQPLIAIKSFAFL